MLLSADASSVHGDIITAVLEGLDAAAINEAYGALIAAAAKSQKPVQIHDTRVVARVTTARPAGHPVSQDTYAPLAVAVLAWELVARMEAAARDERGTSAPSSQPPWRCTALRNHELTTSTLDDGRVHSQVRVTHTQTPSPT